MENERHISYLPTDGLCYNPAEARYWDPAAVEKELVRTFEVCNGCRLCFKYCEAFPTLFSLLDKQGLEHPDVRKLSQTDHQQVLDHCFQCKLCEVQCPYTPRDNHEFQLDFPKLVHRHSAVTSGKRPTWRQRLLGNPDLLARLGRASFGIANLMNRVRLHRILLEKLVGIHRDKLLPDFASQTFEAWARREGRTTPVRDAEVVLFQTCFVQNNDPSIGRDTLFVLEKSGVKTACAQGLACCGMPAWEHGDLASLRRNAARNLDVLLPYVEAGAKVIAINPTCAMMLRREYPELVDPTQRERAKALAAAVRDPGEFLWSLKTEGRLATDFQSTPGSVAYHAPCHLRAQAVGFKGRDLLRQIPGVSIRTVMECSGHDGTFAMRAETFDESKRVGTKAFDAMRSAEAETWVSDCPLAALQFEQHAGQKGLHPMVVLARAYRAGGFPTPVSRDAAAPAPGGPST